MTTEELRSKILESKNPEWFNAVTFRFYNNKNSFEATFKGLPAIYEYVTQQSNGWSSLPKQIPDQFNTIRNKINTLKAQLDSFVSNSVSLAHNALSVQWQNQITNTHNGDHIPYNHPAVPFLIDLQSKYPQNFNGAFQYFFGTQEFGPLVNSKNNFLGVLMAYEFDTKESSEIFSRKTAESATLNTVRKDFEKYINNTESQISQVFNQAKKSEEDQIKLIDNLREQKTKSFDAWSNESKADFENFKTRTSSEFDGLKKTYNELLRLQEPAEYWNKRAIQLKKEGNKFLGIFIGLVLVGIIFLYFLLWQTPEGMLKSFFNEDKSLALRWSIVFITFISLIFIAVRLVSKAMFSAFHLARDAEERQQLTYVYLSLRKDAAVDDKDKQLIMQSLFSRADTGLLKEDSSPTMPGGLDKFIK